MSKPKTYPPYFVDSNGSAQWIADSAGNLVVYGVDLTAHYEAAFGYRIMQILCDALNQVEP